MTQILFVIELLALGICAFFGYKWYLNPTGNYEPLVFLFGLVSVAFELFRRYGRLFFKKNGKVASLIPWVKHWLNRPIIIPHQRQNWWHMGRTGDQKPAMQVVSYWYVTNQSDQPIRILSAYALKNRITGHVVTKDTNSSYHGSYPIPPSSTSDLHVDFWINPPIRREGKKLKLDIVFLDQYGQKIKVRNVVFESDKSKKVSYKILETEQVYKIKNVVEKKVVSVLKDEISRYKKYGRRSGELGSVYALYNGRKIKNIYQDGWTDRKSGERQEIVVDIDNSIVLSENGDTLIAYYHELNKDSEKELFLDSLVSRIDRDKEYYCVTYIIFYVLIKTGHLKSCLTAAKKSFEIVESRTLIEKILKKQPKEDLLEFHQRHGFSNALGLINGLLRWEHKLFSDDELDLIEAFIEDMDEHAFRIEEKLNSIRAFRLNLN